MDKLEENAIRIANYLEDRMSPGEEEAFMKELGENDMLREQYEGELLVQTLLQNDAREEAGTALIGANGEILRPVDEAIQYRLDEDPAHKEARIVSFFSRYKMAVAAAVVLVAGTLVFYLQRNGNAVGPQGPGKGVVVENKTGDGKDTDNLFARYFTRYAGDNDPAVVKSYYDAYRQENYGTVLAVSDSVDWVPGDAPASETARQYIRLYKGLSYLDQGLKEEAIRAFGSIPDAKTASQPVYYEAEWYATLTWLKNHDTGKAAAIAGEISKSPSPYNIKASQLLTELK
jgi:hypothetical protein